MTNLLAFQTVTIARSSGLTGISIIDQTLTPIIDYPPKIIQALIILLVTWIVANIVKWVVTKGLIVAGLDKRLGTAKNPDSGKQTIGTLATVAYWIVFLFFLPAILGALDLQGSLVPINAMIVVLFAYLPNLLAATLIFIIGFLIAGVIRQLVTSLLEGLGVNAFAARNGLGTTLGEYGLAGLLGTIVYVLILIPIITAALNALNLPSVSQPISNMLNQILSAIPNIFGAALILVIAYFVGKIVSNLVTSVLTSIGFNQVPTALGISNLPQTSANKASGIVGNLTLIAIMFFAAIEATHILNFTMLSNIVTQLMEFGGNLLAGLIIFAIGLYLAQLAARIITQSDFSNAATLATVARVAILVFVGAIALRRMGLADDIVNLAFGLTLGAIAVAAAIAFGVGGKDFAKRVLENHVEPQVNKTVDQ